MPVRFGTDGVRGEANVELTPQIALALGRAAASVVPGTEWLIGWDTRLSSTMLAAAYAAGTAAAGRDITLVGEVPSSGLAFVCQDQGRPGAMVTASHNPFFDNGIKLFGPDGIKLADKLEQEADRLLAGADDRTGGRQTGRIEWVCPPEVKDSYAVWLDGRARAIDGSRLRIGLDCAHGAAYQVAPTVIGATGAQVTVIGNDPNGTNINDGVGSTDLTALAQLVIEHGLDFGLAFDGDADRVLAVDEHGETIDGDFIIAVLALWRARSGRLAGNGVVVTEWSNLGLLNGLRDHGLNVEVCEVGDKNVALAMRRTGYALGGEQSGHIIMEDLMPVGDGISTAVELIAAIADEQVSFGTVARHAMRKLPQSMRNVRVGRSPKEIVAALDEQRREVNEGFDGRGRLVLRASGTEPVVRVMAEAEDERVVADLVSRFVDLVTAAGRTD